MEDTGASDLTFSGFVLSLASTAAVHFGDLPDPATGQKGEPDLDAASRVIELLAMLQVKTKGNLIKEEERLLDDLLYELRLRFVQARQDDKRIIEP
ncbi:MAG TPA: DUF1844 domain-containing protein [Vicinamibacterales bacterium]|nr:DUF1844 domain-containing protein [Vicinamibacterales bacterium]